MKNSSDRPLLDLSIMRGDSMTKVAPFEASELLIEYDMKIGYFLSSETNSEFDC